MEPKSYAWVVPGRVAVAERPGGGGRTHRAGRREAEQAWWRDQGIVAVVSGMRTRHGIIEYALDGLVVRWHPLRDIEQARHELPRLADAVHDLLIACPGGGVLVHCDHPNEWLAAADAAVRLRLGVAPDAEEALLQVIRDGFPVGDVTWRLVSGGVTSDGASGRPRQGAAAMEVAGAGTAPRSCPGMPEAA